MSRNSGFSALSILGVSAILDKCDIVGTQAYSTRRRTVCISCPPVTEAYHLGIVSRGDKLLAVINLCFFASIVIQGGRI